MKEFSGNRSVALSPFGELSEAISRTNVSNWSGWGSFRLAFRNMRRNGLYSTINIAGLAVSLAACTFIFLWVQDERSYDRFHRDAKDIYLAVAHFASVDETESIDLTPGMVAVTTGQDFPEVQSYCRTLEQPVKNLKAGVVKTDRKLLLYADNSFFSSFNFPVTEGQKNGLLQAPNQVVISESLARELFGKETPLGKEINIDGWADVFVAAVMKDFPHNTTLPRADMVCPFGVFVQSQDELGSMYLEFLDSWGSCEFRTYFRMNPGADIEKMAQAITAKQAQHKDSRSFTFQPLVNAHLYSLDGEPAAIRTVRLFQWVAFIILCIACVNYVNLVTAQASKRRHEIGLRKVLGARRLQLFSQLILEAGILFLFAMSIAIVLNLLLLPGYNYLSGKDIAFGWSNANIWQVYALMMLSVMALAGLYPAWMLASFRPVMKMQEKRQGGMIRKSLVVAQFVSSIALIMGTITLDMQMGYIRQKDLGFDRDHVFTCEMRVMGRHFDAIKTELLKNTAVREVTCAAEDITDATWSHSATDWEGKTGDGTLSHNRLHVDSNFLTVMKIALVEGGGFTQTGEQQFIINETAARAMGMEYPVAGKWMVAGGGFRGKIVGVTKDFHFNNLHQKIRPMVLYPGYSGGTLYVRTTAKDAGQAIAAVEKLWKQYNPDHTFVYSFMDDTFDRMYRSDVRMGRLFGIFAFIAVLISCLGLFGLVTYTAETKTREIGIRKVLGASVAGIVEMLSKEFLILVGIAMLIAFPLSYYWLDSMLQDYAYRIDIGWWMFVLAGIITVVLTLLTVGWKAVKAATANPVKAIKAE